MRLELVCSLAVVIASAVGCDGPKSHIPAELDQSMGRVDQELSSQEPDAEAVCGALQEVMAHLAEWQDTGRGNQSVRIEKMLRDLDSITIPCQSDAEDVDLGRLGESFMAWSKGVRKQSEVKSGWTTVLLWVLIPSVILGVLIYAKRRFYEA